MGPTYTPPPLLQNMHFGQITVRSRFQFEEDLHPTPAVNRGLTRAERLEVAVMLVIIGDRTGGHSRSCTGQVLLCGRWLKMTDYQWTTTDITFSSSVHFLPSIIQRFSVFQSIHRPSYYSFIFRFRQSSIIRSCCPILVNLFLSPSVHLSVSRNCNCRFI